jgi:hypothetical protein
MPTKQVHSLIMYNVSTLELAEESSANSFIEMVCLKQPILLVQMNLHTYRTSMH